MVFSSKYLLKFTNKVLATTVNYFSTQISQAPALFALIILISLNFTLNAASLYEWTIKVQDAKGEKES